MANSKTVNGVMDIVGWSHSRYLEAIPLPNPPPIRGRGKTRASRAQTDHG